MREKTKVKTMQKQEAIQAIKEQVKGITLIALVVTIIVLLILAGVAISLTIGSNGIFTRAQTAVIVNENASVYEQLQLIVADYQMDNIEAGNDTAILERLKTDGYVNEDAEGNNIVNVKNLMKRSMQTGKGTIETGDVYVLEQRQVTASSVVSDTTEDMDYYLIYYGENNSTSTNLGLAFDGNTKDSLEATGEEWFQFDKETSSIFLIDSNDYYDSINHGVKVRELGLDEIIVPETYQGNKVKSIGIKVSAGIRMGINVSDVKKIILPDTIKTIIDGVYSQWYSNGTGVFAGCTSLQEIELSNNLKTIGSMSFYNCISLATIEIPESVVRIGARAFMNCSSLKEVTFPMNVNYIESNIFEGCDNLEKVIIKGQSFTREELGLDESVEIIYDNEEYLSRVNNFLKNKTTEELEQYILLSSSQYSNFEEWLYNEKGMTREQLEEQANSEGKSYDECLKEIIVNEETEWINVELWYENSEYSKMSVSELENIVAEKIGYDNFDSFIESEFNGREEFEQYLQSIGRSEENFFKEQLYYNW